MRYAKRRNAFFCKSKNYETEPIKLTVISSAFFKK